LAGNETGKNRIVLINPPQPPQQQVPILWNFGKSIQTHFYPRKIDKIASQIYEKCLSSLIDNTLGFDCIYVKAIKHNLQWVYLFQILSVKAYLHETQFSWRVGIIRHHSTKVRNNPNCVGYCHTTPCVKKIVFHLNTP
jgi:hypothetical protein